jgi:signal transduction histidine kinase
MVKRTMAIFDGPKQPSGDWELFLGMWERANLVRAYFWSQRPKDEKILLSHFLTRLRRFFGADFCFGVLSVSEDNLVEVGVPEAGLSQLPKEFSRRCLESVANSRAPVTWNDAGIKLGFRSTVVVPLRAPTGASFGFLMLGQMRSRTYTALELFLLQALAGELSWVARDLAARNAQRQKLAALSHQVKNALQVILGNAALMRQRRQSVPGESDKVLHDIEAAAQLIIERLRVLPHSQARETRSAEEKITDIASAVNQSLAACRGAAKERGIDVEVVYTPDSPDRETLVPERVTRVLSALVDNAALATRNEKVRLAVRRRGGDLELVVKGMESSRVADKLKSLFETAAGPESGRTEHDDSLVRAREYVDNAGGDAYLNSRPGEAAEFVVRLPIES